MIDAKLCSRLSVVDLKAIEQEWSAERFQLTQRLRNQDVPGPDWPESLHWDWGRKSSKLRFLAYQGWAIFHHERCQAAMMSMTVGHVSKLSATFGKPLIYIDYIETAPWNWRVPSLGQVGEFSGLGSLLIRAAIHQSLDEGFYGRVGLHALPQAENFYANVCGMTSLGPDHNYDDLHYYEFTT